MTYQQIFHWIVLFVAGLDCIRIVYPRALKYDNTELSCVEIGLFVAIPAQTCQYNAGLVPYVLLLTLIVTIACVAGGLGRPAGDGLNTVPVADCV